ncbi:MAG: hypothetical protein AB4426_04830 [Xenococcaceae cyanobacterium]
MSNIQNGIATILKTGCQVPAQRSILVAFSGIDGCGKGYSNTMAG